MRNTILVSLALTCLSLTSCSIKDKRVEKGNLVGKYVFQTWNQDTIEVNSNGTYLYYTTHEGRRLENKGTWTYDSIESRMSFADFSFLTDGLPRGYWSPEVEFEDNEVHLIYASDVYKAYYLKIDSVDRSK